MVEKTVSCMMLAKGIIQEMMKIRLVMCYFRF